VWRVMLDGLAVRCKWIACSHSKHHDWYLSGHPDITRITFASQVLAWKSR